MSNLLISIHIFFCCSSQLHNLAITLERAVAVVSPMYHRLIVTMNVSKKVIVGIWVSSGFLFVVAFLRHAVRTDTYNTMVFWLLMLVAFIIPFLAMFPVILIIGIIGYKSVRVRKKSCTDDFVQNELRWQELKIVAHISVMVLPMLSCWAVFFLGTIYEAVAEKTFSGVMNWVLTFLPFFASAFDPLMYILGTRPLRGGVKKLLGSIFGSFGFEKLGSFRKRSVTSGKATFV